MRGFRLRLRPVGLLTVGGSHPELAGADIAFVTTLVDGREVVYVPASSLKGALRSAASRVAESYGFTSCGQTNPELIRRAHSGRGVCDVCRLFGAPSRNPSQLLFFDDLMPEGEGVSRHLITRVRIDDRSLRVAEGGLFTSEAVSTGEFSGQIRYTEESVGLLPLLLLGVAELRLDRLGRRSSVDLRLDATDQLRRDLGQEWHALLEALEGWLWHR